LSWRLPPSAAQLVPDAFYPQLPFVAGTPAASRSLTLARRGVPLHEDRPSDHYLPDSSPRLVDGAGWVLRGCSDVGELTRMLRDAAGSRASCEVARPID
jgi:hypothetical protein